MAYPEGSTRPTSSFSHQSITNLPGANQHVYALDVASSSSRQDVADHGHCLGIHQTATHVSHPRSPWDVQCPINALCWQPICKSCVASSHRRGHFYNLYDLHVVSSRAGTCSSHACYGITQCSTSETSPLQHYTLTGCC